MKLIDADALDAEMYHKSFEVDDGRNVWNSGLWIRYKIFEEAIRDAPTIDAVPVIKCKDCKYYQQGSRNSDDWLWCMMNHHYTDEEKYCAWAERKENA